MDRDTVYFWICIVLTVLITLGVRSCFSEGNKEIIVRHVVGTCLEDDVVRLARSKARCAVEYVVEAIVAEDAYPHDDNGKRPAVHQHGAEASGVLAEDAYLTLRLRPKPAREPAEGDVGEKVDDKSRDVHAGDYSKGAAGAQRGEAAP